MAIKNIPQTIIDVTQDASIINMPSISGVIANPKISSSKSIISKYQAPRFHWTKDKPDSRDYAYQITNATSSGSVDLRPYCTTIEDQGNLGSCTGQAIAGAIEYLNKKNNKTIDVSRLFIYFYEREMLGTIKYDSGAYIRDGIKVVSRYGAPPEKHWPYIISRFTARPNSVALSEGAKRKVTRYERATTFEGVIDALTTGYPVTIGFYVYSSFMSRSVAQTGNMPYPNIRRERLLGGHAVLLVGYDNATERFIVRNSWGSGWGDRGYFYMPYAVIKNRAMSDDFWVIKNVNNPL
jgi:C1A family cysteine protease